jgi:hypothetical protein
MVEWTVTPGAIGARRPRPDEAVPGQHIVHRHRRRFFRQARVLRGKLGDARHQREGKRDELPKHTEHERLGREEHRPLDQRPRLETHVDL